MLQWSAWWVLVAFHRETPLGLAVAFPTEHLNDFIVWTLCPMARPMEHLSVVLFNDTIVNNSIVYPMWETPTVVKGGW